MRPLLLASASSLLACLPSPPALGGEAPRPDVGETGADWPDPTPTWPDAEDDEAPDEVDAGANVPGADPGLSALRITEVLADPDGKDGGQGSPELIELLNPGASAVSLSGLRVEARSWPALSAADLGVADLQLAPEQRLVILRYVDESDAPALPQASPEALTVGFFGASGLRNDDGGVLVRGGLGEVADLIVYGATQDAPFDDPADWSGSPVSAPPSGQSLCRMDESADTDGASDWAACPPTAGSPPAEGGAATTGDVIIVEVLSNPPGTGPEEKLLEYVEVLNAGDEDVDLGGFQIADSTQLDAPGTDPLSYREGDGGCSPSTCLAPGRRALIVGDAYAGPAADALVLNTDDSTIADAGLGLVEPVVLRDGDGKAVSTYRDWLDPQAEPNPAGDERALHRSEPGLVDAPEHWSLEDPSPGA